MRRPLHALLTVAIAALALLAFSRPGPGATAGELLGQPPPPGGFGLVVWSGGPVGEIAPAADSQGCDAVSAWASHPSGGLVGYLFDAPSFVNREFTTTLDGGSLPAQTPLVLVCAPEISQSAYALTAAERRMVELVNEERTSRGLGALAVDLEMSAVARAHSADMAARDYFDHTNPDGDSPFDRMRAGGVSYRTAGENIAWAGSVERSHELLMDSTGHRENILRSAFGRIGIGVVSHPDHGVLVTQVFAD